MITLIRENKSVLIKNGNVTTVYPLNSFIIRKSGDREISLISTITSDRFKEDIANFVPRITEYFKMEIPTEKDFGVKGSIWHSKKTGMFYLHDGEKYVATSMEKIIEIYMLKLANILNS